MTTTVLYMRCSGMSQIDGDTWDRQRATCGKYCEVNAFEILHEYLEKAVPGKTDEEGRPAFQQMIADLLGNGCRTIVIESLDRLARGYAVQEQLITYIASKGLALISANTGEDITAAMMGDPMKRAMVQMQGIFAELDKNMLVAKLDKARKRIKAEGRKPGSPKYSENPRENRRVEGRKPYGNTEKEKAILDIIDGYQKLGFSKTEIANRLNSSNAPTRHGRRWFPATISKILRRSA